MKSFFIFLIKSAVIVLVLCLIGLFVNLIRNKGSIPFVAQAPYEIFTDCPEFQKNAAIVKLNKIINNNDIIYVDARPEQEFKTGHIPGAINIPYPLLSDFPSEEKLIPIRKIGNKKIIVYGEGGQGDLGKGMTSILIEMGFKNVSNLEGGLQSWIKNNGKIESSEASHE